MEILDHQSLYQIRHLEKKEEKFLSCQKFFKNSINKTVLKQPICLHLNINIW